MYTPDRTFTVKSIKLCFFTNGRQQALRPTGLCSLITQRLDPHVCHCKMASIIQLQMPVKWTASLLGAFYDTLQASFPGCRRLITAAACCSSCARLMLRPRCVSFGRCCIIAHAALLFLLQEGHLIACHAYSFSWMIDCNSLRYCFMLCFLCVCVLYAVLSMEVFECRGFQGGPCYCTFQRRVEQKYSWFF